MKVSDVRSGKSVTSVSRQKRASDKGGAFADHLKEAAEAIGTTEATDSPSANPADAVLGVQEAPDATEARPRGLARRRGDELLDHLELLRHELLAGAVSKGRLVGLAQSVRAKRHRTSDPRLEEILDEIELRAEVEVAKLTRDG